MIPGLTTEEDKSLLIQNLKLLQTLEPDVVFSSAFAGKHGYQELGKGEWQHHVQRALDAVFG